MARRLTPEMLGQRIIGEIEFLAEESRGAKKAVFAITANRPADPEFGPVEYRAKLVVDGVEDELLRNVFTAYSSAAELAFDVWAALRDQYEELLDPHAGEDEET